MDESNEEYSQKRRSCGNISSKRMVCLLWGITICFLVCLGALAFLSIKLFYHHHDVDLVKSIGQCARCPKCHLCLYDFTGQNVPSLCEIDDLNTVLQCASQLFYLYSDKVATPSVPCYEECTACRDCIDSLFLGIGSGKSRNMIMELNDTLWETVYPQYFSNSSVIEDNEGCEIVCENGNCGWKCTKALSTGNVRSRRNADDFTRDFDSCCHTLRKPMPYTADHIGDNGKKWYSVWFRKTFPYEFYTFQRYDEIQCPQAFSACNSNFQCLPFASTRMILMTDTPPTDDYGHTYTILTYGSNNVMFFDIDIPSYCRCTT